jgi:tRNA (5-methylaminomethyl-2-thiouridylate)-methyltransferase
MSGGVDSAVAAHLLKEQGCDVVGVFMKNWQDDGQGCSAAADFEDVKSVCAAIGIPYYTVNFEQEYQERVFSYFLSEYKRGRTPNPDVLCNSEIKFAAFLEHAKKLGAERLATGHYARTEGGRLYKAADLSKDQTYFLCMLSREQIGSALFPVGNLQKSEVRRIAERLGLSVAHKKDSTGICFIGERKFRDFLAGFLPAQPGDIMTREGRLVGRHQGVIYYTLGQRRGLGLGGVPGTPDERWFVTDKDVEKNILYVDQGEADALYSRALRTSAFSYISARPEGSFECCAKFRYRQSDQRVRVSPCEGGEHIAFEQRQRAVTPGQYAVLYMGDECLGGGVIEEVYF